MARVLALDLGSKRIGVASSDTTRTLASPVEVVLRRGSHQQDHDAIAKIVEEYEPDTMVVGVPLGLNGKEGTAAQLIRAELVELKARFEPMGVNVVVHDERFTTASAHKSLMERKMKAQDRRHVVDKVAAAVLLQAWLDGEKVRTT
jgi:putative Holliday junction resolvase